MPAPPNGVHYCLDASTIDVLWQYIYDHYLRKMDTSSLTEIIFYEPNIKLFPDSSSEINETNYIAFTEFCNRNVLTRTVYDSDDVLHFQVMGSTRWNADDRRYYGVVVAYRGNTYEIYVTHPSTNVYRIHFLLLANNAGGSVNPDDPDAPTTEGSYIDALDVIKACRKAMIGEPAYKYDELNDRLDPKYTESEKEEYDRVYKTADTENTYLNGYKTPENYWD